MLESIRKHQKIFQWVLLLLIFPSFAFFGIESYMRDMGSDADLVKVAGQSITRTELDNAVKQRADRLREQGRADAAMLASVPFKQAVLGEIVQQRLVGFELKELRLMVSPESLAKDLTQIPEIRNLYKADGSFDAQRYKQLLAQNGMTIEQFEGGRRYDIMSRQALTAVLATGIGSRKVAEKVSMAYETEREIQSIQFKPQDFVSKVNPTQQDIEAFYQANLNRFQSPEIVDVEYILLTGPGVQDRAFAERADLLANMAYEQADSLKPAADRLKLSIQTAKGITRAGLKGAPADHPLNQPKVLAALFNDDAIKNRRNIEAQEVGPGKVLVARVAQHQAQAAIPLAALQEQIKKQVAINQAADLATKTGQERFNALQKGGEASGFSATKWVSRNKPADLSPQALQAIMSVSADKLPTVVSAQSADGGFAIYRVSKIQQPAQVDQKLRARQLQEVVSLATQAEAGIYFDDVRVRASVKQINAVR